MISKLIRQADEDMHLSKQHTTNQHLFCKHDKAAKANASWHYEALCLVIGCTANYVMLKTWTLTVEPLRWLVQRLRDNFQKTGLEFHVDYVTSIRNWTDSLAKFSTLSGAYRKRHIADHKEIPHSFTFARRDSAMVCNKPLMPTWCFFETIQCI